MESIVAVGDALYARDQWGRVWRFSLEHWALTAPPRGAVWVDPMGADAAPARPYTVA